MIYLFDTHYILWSLFEPARINGKTREILENETDTKLVSGINLWEISLKFSLGKLELHGISPEQILEELLEVGFEVAELKSRLLASYHNLPQKDDHRDPFDRMLIWQAISEGYTLITKDEKIMQYVADGLLIEKGELDE